MRGIIVISKLQGVTDNEPKDSSILPWRGTKGGFNPSWLAERGPSVAHTTGLQQAPRLTVHLLSQASVSTTCPAS